MPPETLIPLTISFIGVGCLGGFLCYQWWWRRALIKRKLVSLFPEGREWSLLESSEFESHGSFDLALDLGGYQIALYSEYRVPSSLYEYFFVVKQPLAFGSDVPEGIYEPGGILAYFDQGMMDLPIYKRRDLRLVNSVHDSWLFAEVSAGELILFYPLPQLVGYGCLEEVATWVRMHYG